MDPQDSGPIPPPDTPKQIGGQPERYIRTFAGDIDVVQRGGTPGLSPLKTPEPVEPPPSAEAPSDTVVPQPEPVAPPEPAPRPEFQFKPPTQATPEPIVVPEPTPEPEVVPEARPLQTYADDFRQHMQETHASKATVLAAEQDAGPHDEPETELEPQQSEQHTGWYVAAGLIFVALGAGGAFYAYSNFLVTQAPVIVGPTTVAPVFVDSTESVSGSGAALMQAVVQAVKNSQPANTVRLLSLASATTTNVFLSLGVPVPGILVRNITDSGNMAGVVSSKGVQSPFFIESVDLYSATFSGMLSWEPTMQRDLNALFPLYPVAPAPAPETASSTASSTPRQATATTPAVVAAKAGFRDEVVSNHDVRVYRDALGRSILLYGYWNQKTLVIARDPAAFTEILDRLATSHAQ